jgi:HSP20 family protein
MATLNRWSPFEEALSLRDAMSRLFEDSFVSPAAVGGRAGSIGVEMNVYENEHGFAVEASVPGLKPEDLDITLQDNVLTISGEFHEEKPAENATVHRVERRFGRFSRSVALPTMVKPDAISANLENGILRLEIPKAEEVKPRKISIQAGRQPQLTAEKNREVGK